MEASEKIIIPPGTMVNVGNNEDDDPWIATDKLEAIVLGPEADGGIPILIPEIDPQQTYYYHQPQKTK